jgi:transposase
MPRPYSGDLRERVLLACEQDEGSRAAIARRFRVGESTIYTWLQVARIEGRRAAKPHAGGPPPKLDAAGLATLKDLVLEQNDATLTEYGEQLLGRTGCQLGTASLCRALQKLNLVRKKRLCVPASRTVQTSL